MNKTNKHSSHYLTNQSRLYRMYADAVQQYVEKPTIINWEKKEKAFETYNALIENLRNA